MKIISIKKTPEHRKTNIPKYASLTVLAGTPEFFLHSPYNAWITFSVILRHLNMNYTKSVFSNLKHFCIYLNHLNVLLTILDSTNSRIQVLKIPKLFLPVQSLFTSLFFVTAKDSKVSHSFSTTCSSNITEAGELQVSKERIQEFGVYGAIKHQREGKWTTGQCLEMNAIISK